MERINIGGRLHSVEVGNVVTGANEILDDTIGEKQDVINQRLFQAVEGITDLTTTSSWDNTEYPAYPTDI